MWARIKLNGQHSSLEEASPYPLFNGGAKKSSAKQESLSKTLTTAATVVAGIVKGNDSGTNSAGRSMSPGKRTRASGLYLEQLERLKMLQQSGVLMCEEFEEQKCYALKTSVN